jgi:hypothetical protein
MSVGLSLSSNCGSARGSTSTRLGQRTGRIALAATVWGAGLLARIFCIIYNSGSASDSLQYTSIAQHLLRSGTYAITDTSPTLCRPPGYPLFVAAVYALFGPSDGTVLAAQAVLGACAGVLLYLLLRRMVSAPVAATVGIMAAKADAPAPMLRRTAARPRILSRSRTAIDQGQ